MLTRRLREGDGQAELAVAVVDRWQRAGIGRLLLAALRREGRRLGYRHFATFVLPENAAAVALVDEAFPGTRATTEEGVVQLVSPIDADDQPRRTVDLSSGGTVTTYEHA